VTAERLGASVAVILKFAHPLKALSIVPHTFDPQFLTWSNFNLSPWLLKNIPGNNPFIFTVYVPGVAYVFVNVVVINEVDVPSPQSAV